jgi:Caenorhabditis elegans protein of unknown function (DUF976).
VFYIRTLLFLKLVVHVGVSSLASGLTLEVKAHKSGYCRQDTQGKVPPRNEISSGKAEVMQPVFDVEDICKAVHESNTQVLTCCSADAGRCVLHLLHIFGPKRRWERVALWGAS